MSLLLLNREIGILEFNSRVLAQAEDTKIPLLERIRFLSIVSSNLDEFFEIRMAGIKEPVKQVLSFYFLRTGPMNNKYGRKISLKKNYYPCLPRLP